MTNTVWGKHTLRLKMARRAGILQKRVMTGLHQLRVVLQHIPHDQQLHWTLFIKAYIFFKQYCHRVSFRRVKGKECKNSANIIFNGPPTLHVKNVLLLYHTTFTNRHSWHTCRIPIITICPAPPGVKARPKVRWRTRHAHAAGRLARTCESMPAHPPWAVAEYSTCLLITRQLLFLIQPWLCKNTDICTVSCWEKVTRDITLGRSSWQTKIDV